MDQRLVRNRLVFILEHVRQSQTFSDPFARARQGLSAINRILALMAELDADIAAMAAAEVTAAQARTACREHLYPRSQPCVHDDDGQEELGMGEPQSTPPSASTKLF